MAVGGKTPNLDQFTVNLTENAREGKDRSGAGARFRDPAGGRYSDAPPPEQSHSDGRSRRRQDRGGGRLRAAHRAGRRSAGAEEREVRTLDLALLQAGAGVKGEFENRLKGLIEEVKSSPTPIILFIDEAHTMIGAGGQAGQGDAANLLKPALARGELRTIAATTWSEYKKYFEKDPGAGPALPGGEGGRAGPKRNAW
jgi:type VI secretion system protein VasG